MSRRIRSSVTHTRYPVHTEKSAARARAEPSGERSGLGEARAQGFVGTEGGAEPSDGRERLGVTRVQEPGAARARAGTSDGGEQPAVARAHGLDAACILADPGARAATFEEARDLCRALAGAEGENFTVISWLAPRVMREHLAAVYAFCRTADNLGDEDWVLEGRSEGTTAAAERIALLDRFEVELDLGYAGSPRHPVFVALRPTIERFDLPREPFARLIEANRMDQRAKRCATFADLLRYCDHSATPVGRLVLMLYGRRDDEELALSDATCIGLQLANFWQDVRRDYAIGRVYLPQDEMADHGVRYEDLAAATASEPLRRLLHFQVERTRDYFARGLPLLDRVSGRLRVDLALFSRGGLAILDKIERQGYDTLVRRPTVGKMEKVGILLSTLLSRRWRRWI